MARWIVQEIDGFESSGRMVRVFMVYDPHVKVYEKARVWFDEDQGPRCAVCSGPLSAMLSSCAHARAVKRFVSKGGTPDIGKVLEK